MYIRPGSWLAVRDVHCISLLKLLQLNQPRVVTFSRKKPYEVGFCGYKGKLLFYSHFRNYNFSLDDSFSWHLTRFHLAVFWNYRNRYIPNHFLLVLDINLSQIKIFMSYDAKRVCILNSSVRGRMFPARGRDFGHHQWLNWLQFLNTANLTVCCVQQVLFCKGPCVSPSLLALSSQTCSSLTPGSGTSLWGR